MNTDYQKEIRDICTYYSDLKEGTAGYCLSEEQFQKLFALLQQSNKEAEERVKERIVKNWVLLSHDEYNQLTHPEEVHTDPDLEGRI